MSDFPTHTTPTGRDEELRGGASPAGDAEREALADRADGGADTGAGPEADLAEGDDVSGGVDGVGGGNDSRSSLLEDTLGAGGDPDELDDEQ